MRDKTLKVLFLIILAAGLFPVGATAAGPSNGIARQLLAKEALPNVPGHNLTAVVVELAPGAVAPAHKHEAFLFVHVLAGKVRSKLGDTEAMDYAAGESWTEPPGTLHTLTENLSKMEPAKILVIFVGKEGAKLTTSGKIE